MLELRPNCELCDRDLPHDSLEARICTYECTYCAECVETVLHDVCPTCGGNFAPRPIRPRASYRESLKLGLQNNPASTKRVHSRWERGQLEDLCDRLKTTPPAGR
ncbi:DUF1272 domain-containing protein [Roseibium sp. Sym1]|uniref:DUF1272 domain-containing protein n=1 Tax=Roseibium sp. Sym1 TaxID=3016006 RepID=UPI0022B37157|nr:DUF1272 domain-containing protein [Roseibium sp. Sym1]